jgi:exosortase/archaeosortase family protein
VFNTNRSVLYIGGHRALRISSGCNGLELVVLYTGLFFPVNRLLRGRSRLLFWVTIGNYMVNCFRCFGLARLFANDYAFADFAHHYLFKMMIYGIIFFAWVVCSKKYYDEV